MSTLLETPLGFAHVLLGFYIMLVSRPCLLTWVINRELLPFITQVWLQVPAKLTLQHAQALLNPYLLE